jgi:hypothetical protein
MGPLRNEVRNEVRNEAPPSFPRERRYIRVVGVLEQPVSSLTGFGSHRTDSLGSEEVGRLVARLRRSFHMTCRSVLVRFAWTR